MKKIEIVFLGTGNALINDSGNYHSNLVISYGKDRLFIDCGSDFPHALHAADLSYRDVEHLYISHIHGDHAGGLEWLGFINHFDKAAKKINLYCVPEVREDLDTILKPSMLPSIQTFGLYGVASCFNLPLANHGFIVGEIYCSPIKTLHVKDYAYLYSYGLLITIGEKNILFTSDTQFNPEVFMKYYKTADLILHECSTSAVKYPVHAHISDLQTLPDDIKEKMYLYHYGPGEKPNAVDLGFKGYAVQREIITL
jgi:ribonuclease BN (tRNA processing enzyme)